MSQFSLSVLKYRVWTMNYLYLFIYKVLSIYGISSKNISTLVGCSWWTSDRKVAGRIPAPLGWNWATCRSILEQGTEPQNCSWCAVATCVAATAISKGPGMSWRLIQGVPWPSPTVTGFGTVTPPYISKYTWFILKHQQAWTTWMGSQQCLSSNGRLVCKIHYTGCKCFICQILWKCSPCTVNNWTVHVYFWLCHWFLRGEEFEVEPFDTCVLCLTLCMVFLPKNKHTSLKSCLTWPQECETKDPAQLQLPWVSKNHTVS